MTKRKLMQPVKYLKNNQCPECESKLVLVEQTVSFCDIDDRGLPLNVSLSEEIEVNLNCPNCGAMYEAEKKGPYFYIKPILPKINRTVLEDYNPFLLKD